MGDDKVGKQKPESSIGVDSETKADIANAVEKVPWVGAIIAYIIRRGWWGMAAVTFVLLVIVPFLAPLLAACYISLLPQEVHRFYADVVTSAFTVDDRILKQIEYVVKENNANLDFVQQYQAEWTDPYQTRFTTYTFPLKPGQDFDVQFTVGTRAVDKPCSNASTEASAAEDALSNDQLFHIYINGGLDYTAGATDDTGGNRQYRKAFWDKQANKTSATENAESATGSVQVRLSTNRDATGHSLAERVLRCYRLSSGVRVIVYKTLVLDMANSALKAQQHDSGGDQK